MAAIDGFINLNKPAGWTSHDCVAKVRRLLRIKRVGHGGTLDPAATGVLPIAVGRATRLIPYLSDGKAYHATIRFGVRTTTDDLEGESVMSAPCPDLNVEAITALLPQFHGRIQQIPPKYSAIQVGGKRLYELARAGIEVEVPVRTVDVHQISVLNWRSGDFPELEVAIACGGGTYIRAIARDLGDQAGVGATLAQLSRTSSSGFSLVDSITLDELAARSHNTVFHPIPPQQALPHLPLITLSPQQVEDWRNGRAIAGLIPSTDATAITTSPSNLTLDDKPSDSLSSDNLSSDNLSSDSLSSDDLPSDDLAASNLAVNELASASTPTGFVQVCSQTEQFLGIGYWSYPPECSVQSNPSPTIPTLQPKVVFT